ncbi:hypothetical protein [Micavibrio aeruginosavorus]|uniref:hypothetical protein n=1 Tax=Micavibrio aeruginosavorus TaxID=349221 RepID=UPI003F4AE173
MVKSLRLFVLLTSISAFMITACAPHSEDIKAAYVSPMHYEDFSCKQIRSEMMRVSRKVQEISGVQDDQATGDSVALGVGLVLFWPALFFMIGDDQKEEISRLKGEYDALEQSAIQKNCDISRELEAARVAAEKKKAERQASQQSAHKAVND